MDISIDVWKRIYEILMRHSVNVRRDGIPIFKLLPDELTQNEILSMTMATADGTYIFR